MKELILQMLSEQLLSEKWGKIGEVLPREILDKHKPTKGRYSNQSRGIGQNSEFEYITKPTWSSIKRHMKENGGQIFIFSDKDNWISLRTYKDNSYNDRIEKNKSSFSNKKLRGAEWQYSSVEKAVRGVLSAFAEEGIECKVVVVYNDSEMEKTQSTRIATKKGSIPLPSDKKNYEAYIRNTKSELEKRLGDFKTLKVPVSSNKEELSEILKSGYPEFLNINGEKYEREDQSMYLFSKNSTATVSYSMRAKDTGDNTPYDMYRSELKDKFGDDWDAIRDALQQMFPGSIKVFVKLEGNLLKATKIVWGRE